MDAGLPICHWNAPCTQFEDPNPTSRWCILLADKAIGKLTEDFSAGALQLKLSINDVAKNGEIDFNKQPVWSKKPPKRLGHVVNVRAYIFQCRDIPSADDDGQSDCYISIWNQDGETIRTKSIYDSLNPVFYETKQFTLEFNQIHDAPPFILNLWDHNDDAPDKYLGRSIIRLQDASTNEIPEGGFSENLSQDIVSSVPKPKWHNVRLGNHDSHPVTGQVLCSFIIAPDDQVFKLSADSVKLQTHIPMKEYDIDIHVFGLRNLQSFGLMPIRKPFLKFDIKSLLAPERAMAASNT